jgi:hypothetical protein
VFISRKGQRTGNRKELEQQQEQHQHQQKSAHAHKYTKLSTPFEHITPFDSGSGSSSEPLPLLTPPPLLLLLLLLIFIVIFATPANHTVLYQIDIDDRFHAHPDFLLTNFLVPSSIEFCVICL